MKSFRSRALLLLPAAALLLAASPLPTPGFEKALAAVSPERIRARLKFLSDDLLEGRGTGARGSEIAARYIASEFAVNGLKPAGDAGTYLQNFELVGVKAQPSSALALKTPKGEIALKDGDNAIFSSRSQQAKVSLDAPLVF